MRAPVSATREMRLEGGRGWGNSARD